MATMSEDNYVNHVPVMIGAAAGRDGGILQQPVHAENAGRQRLTPVCRMVSQERVIGEMIFAFSHEIVLDWMFSGIAPMGAVGSRVSC